MRFDIRQISIFALAGAFVLCSSGCVSAPLPSVDSHAPSSAPSAPVPVATPAEANQNDPPQMSAFEQQLPLTGQFVTQSTETVGSVEIARDSEGTIKATFTDFSTGTSPNLRLYLNEGGLVTNADGAWTTDAGLSYEIAPVMASASPQEVEIPGSNFMNEIHSVTVVDYTSPDFLHFGSAPLG